MIENYKENKPVKMKSNKIGFLRTADSCIMTENDKISLIKIFLLGYLTVDRPSQITNKFINHGAGTKDANIPKISGVAYIPESEEKEARIILAEMLRSGKRPDKDICNLLADLFDAKPQDDREQRILIFKFRSRGKRQNTWIKTRIAEHVFELESKGHKAESAIHSTMKQFNISRSEVNRVRKQYRALYVAMGRLSK